MLFLFGFYNATYSAPFQETVNDKIKEAVQEYEVDLVWVINLDDSADNLNLSKVHTTNELAFLSQDQIARFKNEIRAITTKVNPNRQIFALGPHYLLFCFQRGEASGFCLQYNEQFGYDRFRIYSASLNNEQLRISGLASPISYHSQGDSENLLARFHYLQIPDWSSSDLHRAILDM